MSRQIIVIILIIIAVIIFLIIIGFLISFIFRAVSTPTAVVTPTPTPTSIPTVITTPTPTPISSAPIPTPTPQIIVVTPTPVPVTTFNLVKTVTGPGFTLNYPANWGLLTCNNSPNFEFDPATGIDQLNVICGTAQKPITVIVDNSLAGCDGTTVSIGSIPTLKSTTVTPNFTQNLWCTNTNPVLKITNRVSTTGFPASSPIDYTPEIESMISTLRTSTIV